VLFNFGNLAVWACCVSTSFDWDERVIPATIVIVPIGVLVVMGDATCSDFEYSIRTVFLVFTTLICFSGNMGAGLQPAGPGYTDRNRCNFGIKCNLLTVPVVLTQLPNTPPLTAMVLDQGGLFNDVESILWVFNTRDGFHATTAEAWEASNSTALADDDKFITLHAYLRSIGNTRLLFFTLFVGTAAWASIYHPTECAILKNAARRSLIGGSREDAAYAPVNLQRNYERMALDAESEATASRLGDNEEVIVFMPAEEIIIPDGPRRSILCFLLWGNHRMAKRVNDFLEEHKAWGQMLILPSFIIFLVAMTEVVPLNLTWLSVLLLGDTTRCFFKLNMQAAKLCIREPFNFMVPFVTLTLGLIGGMASFDFHLGCCAGFMCLGYSYVTLVLLGKFSFKINILTGAINVQ
jgi:hypothetical protein